MLFINLDAQGEDAVDDEEVKDPDDGKKKLAQTGPPDCNTLHEILKLEKKICSVKAKMMEQEHETSEIQRKKRGSHEYTFLYNYVKGNLFVKTMFCTKFK